MESGNEADVRVHPHVPALDGVRGCAAAMVFVYHYGGGAQSSFLPIRAIGTLIRYGGAGVSLFFVLSGFLISGILWDGYSKPNWWKRFYLRRSLRIFPLYYLAILFAAAVWLFSGISPGQIFPLLYYALYLGDIPFLLSAFRQLPSNIPLGHFWSLAVEEQFYIFWPFVLAMFVGRRRSAKTLIVILWLLSLGFRLAMLGLHAQAEWQWQFLFGRTGELLAGAYLALLVRGGEDEQARLFRWLPAVFSVSAILIVIVAVLAGQPGFEAPLMSTLGLSICSLLFGSMIGLSLQHGVSQRFFSLPALRWLGKISYGVYVYHLLLRSSFAWITDHICQILGAGTGYNTRLIVLFFVATLGTLSVASLSFYTYESAFLRWKDRFAR